MPITKQSRIVEARISQAEAVVTRKLVVSEDGQTIAEGGLVEVRLTPDMTAEQIAAAVGDAKWGKLVVAAFKELR